MKVKQHEITHKGITQIPNPYLNVCDCTAEIIALICFAIETATSW